VPALCLRSRTAGSTVWRLGSSLLQVDLADEEQLQRIEGAVRSINAEASVVRCHRCEIDLGRILNTGIYSAAGRAAEAVPVADARSPPTGARGTHAEQQGQHSCDDPGCSDPHHHHHSDSSGQHDGRVGTVTVLLPPGRAVDLPRLRRWLDELLWEQDGGRDGAAADDSTAGRAAAVPEIFRIKGLLHVAGSDSKHVLQGVHEIYDVVEGPHWAPGEQRCCKLVFIGRQLNREALQQGVESCLAS
jgi:G3E family GTPase